MQEGLGRPRPRRSAGEPASARRRRTRPRLRYLSRVTGPAIELPLVDLEAAGGSAELRQALFETGFFRLADHVIPRSLLDDVRRATLAFLARPEDEKRRYQARMRGWAAFGSESVAAGYGVAGEPAGADACEKFSMGFPVTPALRQAEPAHFDDARAALFFRANLFPDDRMEGLWADYYARMQRLCGRLVAAASEALGLPAGVWDAHHTHPPSLLRFLAYPDHGEGIRMGAHYDDTLFTVLHQSVPENGFGALQVQLPGEEGWQSVEPGDDVFVVNVGEALTFLSGGRIVATKHRVVGPPDERAQGSARTSLAHFYLPNWNARLRPSLERLPDARRTRIDTPEAQEPDGSVIPYKLQQRQVAEMRGDEA